MFGSRQCFGKEVGENLVTRVMLNRELTLANAITKPMKAQIDALGLALFDGVRGEADGKFIVAENGCGWLRVPEGNKDVTQTHTVLGVDKRRGIFSLAG